MNEKEWQQGRGIQIYPLSPAFHCPKRKHGILFPYTEINLKSFPLQMLKCWTLSLKGKMLSRGLLTLLTIKLFIFNLVMQKITGQFFSVGNLFLMILMLGWVLMFSGWDIYWVGAENMEDFRKFPVVKSLFSTTAFPGDIALNCLELDCEESCCLQPGGH